MPLPPPNKRTRRNLGTGRRPGRGAPRRPRPLYLLSDSTGNLARHMVGTFLTQFPADAFRVQPFSFVQSDQRLRQVLDRIVQEPGVVLHAVVSPKFKRAIAVHCRKHRLPCRDLTGPFVDFLARHSKARPRGDRRFVHPVDEAYHRRIRALEFTLEHDDGLGLATLHEADVVLVGVSRTSKTPTSIFLSQQGLRIANVPLALEVEPPAELLAMPRDKVVGLWLEPSVLAEMRARRQATWRMSNMQYVDPDHVAREMAFSRRLFARQNWRSLDITSQAVEETAGRIITLLGLGSASF